MPTRGRAADIHLPGLLEVGVVTDRPRPQLCRGPHVGFARGPPPPIRLYGFELLGILGIGLFCLGQDRSGRLASIQFEHERDFLLGTAHGICIGASSGLVLGAPRLALPSS